MPGWDDIPDLLPPREPPGPCLCRRCNYDLKGHNAHDNITCPECGLTGTLTEITAHAEVTMSPRCQLAVMAGPSAACFLIAILATETNLGPAEGLASLLFLVGLFYAVLAPPIVASSVIEDHAKPGSKLWKFLSGVAIGWGANLIAVLLIWLIRLAISTL